MTSLGPSAPSGAESSRSGPTELCLHLPSASQLFKSPGPAAGPCLSHCEKGRKWLLSLRPLGSRQSDIDAGRIQGQLGRGMWDPEPPETGAVGSPRGLGRRRGRGAVVQALLRTRRPQPPLPLGTLEGQPFFCLSPWQLFRHCPLSPSQKESLGPLLVQMTSGITSSSLSS